jgi:glycyl-tRNA synthetase beta subunit
MELATKNNGSVNDFLKTFLPSIPIINNFFERVMVMSENGGERKNRLEMLHRISALATGVADFSKLEGF